MDRSSNSRIQIGTVVLQQVDQGKTFRSTILEVAHVHVSAATIEKEASVASGLIPIPLVHVGQAIAGTIEDPIADAPHCAGRTGWIGRQTAVFRSARSYFSRSIRERHSGVQYSRWPMST